MKNEKFILAGIIALTLILCAWILGSSYKYKFKSKEISEQTIEVKGLGKKNFEADIVKWSATFKTKANDLKSASADLVEAKKIVQSFINAQGINPKETAFSSIDINEDYTSIYNKNTEEYQQIFNGYELKQTLSVTSKDLDKIAKASREITDLISQGINLNSASPNYYYSKLEDLKLELISQATENARKRAENIANKSNAKLGKLLEGKMGIFQITGQNSEEDFTYGGVFNTQNRKKTANITVNLIFNSK